MFESLVKSQKWEFGTRHNFQASSSIYNYLSVCLGFTLCPHPFPVNTVEQKQQQQKSLGTEVITYWSP